MRRKENFQILIVGLTVKYGPQNWTITPHLLTERYNKVSYFVNIHSLCAGVSYFL